MTTIGLLVERFRVLIRGALKANALPVAAAMEMEEDWLSLWEEENGLCAVNQQVRSPPTFPCSVRVSSRY